MRLRAWRVMAGGFIVAGFGAAIACGVEYTSTKDTTDASSADASSETTQTTSGDGSTTDGAVADAHPDANFCAVTPSIFCADFDESSATSDAGFASVKSSANTTLSISNAVAKSTPNSLFATFLTAVGETGVSGVAQQLNVPNISGSGMTLAFSIEVPAVPHGLEVGAIVFQTGDTTVIGTLSPDGANAKLGWHLSTPSSSLSGGSDLTIGSFHAIAVQIVQGQLTSYVDGAMAFSAPLGSPTDAITIQFGLAQQNPDASIVADNDNVYFDNIVVTSP